MAPALTALLALEKRTRLAADAFSTAKVAVAILDLLHSTGSWALLNDHISLLSKRRAQLQKVQETVVQTAVSYVPSTPDEATKRALIDALRSVSAGKMFVELERARLTRTLAEMEEKGGKVAVAAELMQEVAVETIGTMEAKEKLDFLLEQIRLCLAKRDYVRTEIIAKKVDAKQLKEKEFAEEKVRYHRLMIEYHLHFGQYFDIAKAYREIYLTPSIQAKAEEWRPVLTQLVLFSLLSPFDSEVSDFIARIKEDKQLHFLPDYRQLLLDYVGHEVIAWPLNAQQQREILGNTTFKQDSTQGADDDGSAPMKDDGAASTSTAATAAAGTAASGAAALGVDASADSLIVHNGAQRLLDLHKRVVQHNMRVIALYYDRISSVRFSALLQLTPEAAELYLSELVSSGQLYVKIDRPRGEIQFVRGQDATSVINDFTHNIDTLLALVELTCHTINKELMVHRARA